MEAPRREVVRTVARRNNIVALYIEAILVCQEDRQSASSDTEALMTIKLYITILFLTSKTAGPLRPPLQLAKLLKRFSSRAPPTVWIRRLPC